MSKQCNGCGYIRSEKDEHIAEWECPSCSRAYVKTDKELTNNQAKNKSPTLEPIKAAKMKHAIIIIIIIMIVLGAMYFYPKQPSIPSITKQPKVSDESKDEIESSIQATRSRLSKLNIEISKYSGGLIHTVLLNTKAIEAETLAMLLQKQSSWLYGVNLDYTIDGKPFVLTDNANQLVEGIDNNISDTKKSIEESYAEASRYSGGLILATILSTNATQQQTLAMLEQRRFALIYELPQYVGFSGVTSESNKINNKPKPAIKKQWDIISIDSKVTEKNNVWWKYAWKLTMRNRSSDTVVFTGNIEFLDGDGFVIDDALIGASAINSGVTKTFTGYTLVNVPGAYKVHSTTVKITERH